MKKELSDKVETIGKPIDEKNQLSQGCTVDSGAVQIAVQQVKEQPIWHDADKVFPEFDKNVLGYFERSINGRTIEIYGICHLESITENAFGQALRYVSSGEQVHLFYWTEIPRCPLEQAITENQENEIN
jgi:hypothetical protein